MASIQKQLEQNGFAIIEDFLTQNQIVELKAGGEKLAEDALKEKNKFLFSALNSGTIEPQSMEQYFLDSADRISFFYETNTINEKGEFKIDPINALNKVGHALHRLEPSFRSVTCNEKVTDVCKAIGLQKPAVVQSMYIYKNARVGGEVCPHQDASYLHINPPTLYGFWYALDDATLENGCLWFIPGSHKTEKLSFRYVRNPDKESQKLCIEIGTKATYDESKFIATPMKKGSCVVFHGHIVHRSLPNLSEHSRHAYTFHVYDKAISKYSEENWLQAEFETLY